MANILIEACVTTYPDGTDKTRLRKAILDESGHLLAKYFLTHYGEWIEVKSAECIPDECALTTSIHEHAEDSTFTLCKGKYNRSYGGGIVKDAGSLTHE